MNTDTIAIIVAILGVGLGLWRAVATIRQDVTALRQEVRGDIAGLRQEMAALRQELRTDIAALHSRIDNLYQALFSRKDPAA
jgi:predicted  nucleic acid-binding Zn-ribbon protein